MSDTKETNVQELPKLVQYWFKVLSMVPSLKFPGTQMEIGFTLFSSIVLFCIRLLGIQLLQQIFSWPIEPKSIAIEGSASIVGIVHSTLLCPGLMVAFSNHRYHPSEPRKCAPMWWQTFIDTLIQFCTGYMIYDGSMILLNRFDFDTMTMMPLQGDDILFLGHHLATTLYMIQTRIYQAGHMSAMMCMVLGELSNPSMNLWFITSKAMTLQCCQDNIIVQMIHKYNEIFFCLIYLMLRVILGPLICIHMSYNIFCSQHAKDYLPIPLRMFWNAMIWMVILGSYSWIVFTYGLLMKHFDGSTTESEL